ncbi:MAG TPA: hypothetical protein VFQ47_00535 [Nitrososphaera sp.]|jgi:hypothetical protein|nr:hypothetical protein [Nitrososphaera sp.]
MDTNWEVNSGTDYFNPGEVSYFNFLDKHARGNLKKVLLLEDHEKIFLDFLEYLRCFTDKKYLFLDVKYMSTHHITECWRFITEEPFFFSLIKKYNVRVLNLTRRNFLRYYLSESKSQKAQRWHEFDESMVGDRPWYNRRRESVGEKYERRVTVDTDDLLHALELCLSENKVVEKSLANYEYYLTFDYDDLFSYIGAPVSDSVLSCIAQWLNIADDFPQKKPEYKKQSYLPLEETIQNYEEVVQALQETGFEYCLEDEKMYLNSSVST